MKMQVPKYLNLLLIGFVESKKSLNSLVEFRDF
jgi:hypothetical protein